MVLQANQGLISLLTTKVRGEQGRGCSVVFSDNDPYLRQDVRL